VEATLSIFKDVFLSLRPRDADSQASELVDREQARTVTLHIETELLMTFVGFGAT
jgi:hypothetical protein